jgi:hypothetical protein
MQYLDFLARIHELLTGPPYLEIGIRHGDSLALARGPAVGVDPGFELRVDLPSGVQLFEETSDEYFDRQDPLAPLGGRRVGYSFIDGMHLAEFALRDFINVERLSRWSTVVVFDDIFPRAPEEANRDRETRAWTGDVYKVPRVLAGHRPDLVQLHIDTEPTGLLLVLALDRDSAVLGDRYDEIVRGLVTPDPQDVPEAVLRREGALDPQAVLDASFWDVLRQARGQTMPREDGVARLRKALTKDFGREVSGEPRRPLGRLLGGRGA